MAQHRVFVYGTLMQGLRNHRMMDCAKYLGQGKTLLPGYTIVQFPSQSSPGNVTPGLKKHGNDCILGEVYLASDECLAVLDEFEGVGVEYERARVMLEDGSSAWAYFLLAEKMPCAKGTPSFVSRAAEDERAVFWDGQAEEAFANQKRMAA